MADREILTRETDARFWSQTGYKPGQKLDPNNPTDKAWAAVWLDIFKKVQRESDAGKLVTTYDHPEVAQHLSDAAVAGKAAAAHADIAASAPEAKTAQENVVAATTAQGISTQKAREAAAKQPPTVDPKLVKDAGQSAAKSPPPAQAPASAHIAHTHTREHAYEHARAVHEESPARAALYKEANIRFWKRTNYKPGQSLDMTIEQDRKMAKVWMDIFHQVQREARAGTLVFTPPEVGPPVPPAAPSPVGPPPRVPAPAPPASPTRPFPAGPLPPPIFPRLPLMPPFVQPPMRSPMAPSGMRPPMQHPPMMPPAGRPQMGPQGSQAPQMTPQGPQMGPQAPQGTQAPQMEGPQESPPASTEAPGGEPSPPGDGTPPEESNIGKYIAIGAVVLAGGGLIYYATTRESSRKAPPRARSRARTPSTPPAFTRAPARMAPQFLLPASELDE